VVNKGDKLKVVIFVKLELKQIMRPNVGGFEVTEILELENCEDLYKKRKNISR
jgi:hypothetical protein